ncbi:hypothetical protein [Komagataeibacter diospyri]|uniref:Phage-Barnase-EndoU-ColicinE5/D-RelE like nuclease 3 domain-containing protein n=1 Tax=Komagataeibacter diospyri TaxID=1932662 RepID=A0A4P5NTC9_9PROT|nr:hypothetical protein [Komagataeibacter diospyri]GCE83131.1 hypothetical protein MSKU9_1272 [Komagataeibacter diospyri]
MPFISGDPIEAASVQQQGTDNMQSTLGQTLGAAVSEGIHDTPVMGIADWVRHRAQALDPNILTADQANSRYQTPGLKFSAPVSDALANDLYQQKHAQAVRQATMASGPGGILGGTARIGGGLLPQFLDPLNVVSAFVPGMGEARAASILGRFGVDSRLAARGLAGATQGMAGQAALEPLNYGISQDEHNDWTMGQALTNVAFGGLLGGGMHMAFPARELEKAQPTKDTAPTLDDMANPVSDRMESLSPEARNVATNEAIAALAQDRPNVVGELTDAIDPEGAGQEIPTQAQDQAQGMDDRPWPPTRPEDVPGTPLDAPVRVGHIPEGIDGVPSLPIILSEGQHYFPGSGAEKAGDNYGRLHIEAQHGRDIRSQGYPDAVSFVRDTIGNASEIRRDTGSVKKMALFVNRIEGKTVSDSRHNAAVLHLIEDGEGHYRVATASPFKYRALKKKELLWSQSAQSGSPRPDGDHPSYAQSQVPSGSTGLGSGGMQSSAANILTDASRRKILEDTSDITSSRRSVDQTEAAAPQVTGGTADDELAQARAAVDDANRRLGMATDGEGKMTMPEGMTDEDRKVLDDIHEQTQRAEGDARAYEAAAGCMIGNMKNG